MLMAAQPCQANSTQPNQDLHISLDLEQKLLTGSSRITLPPHTTTTIDFHELTVNRLSVDGTNLSAEDYQSGTLALSATGLPKSIEINYQVRAGVMSENGVVLDSGWHPYLDQTAIFQLTAEIPARFEAISEADQVTSTLAGDIKTMQFFFPHPAKYIHLLAGPYLIKSKSLDNGITLLSYFFPEDQDLADTYLNKAQAYLERYIREIGPYPYKRFAIVENRLPTGYAMPTFTLLGQAIIRLPFIVETSLGHEVLHSWFGNGVGVVHQNGNWCEGLTTYLADQAYATDKGQGRQYRKEQLLKYAAYVTPENSFSLTEFTSGSLDRGRSEQANRAIGYNKVAMVFHMLKKRFGKQMFMEAIQDFSMRMQDKDASWQDIQVSFEKTTSSDLEIFFRQWLDRKDIPDLQVQKLGLREEEGKILLSFILHQGTETPYENLEIPLIVQGQGQEIKKIIISSETDKTVEIPLPFYPTQLVIDPDYDMIRHLSPTETTPTWASFAGAAKKLVVVSSTGDFDLFEPMITELEAQGAEVLADDEVTDSDLASQSVLFLGLKGAVPRGLFAQTNPPEDGFTIDIRSNPLNQKHVAILASAADQQQVKQGFRKLRHYGKYSYLHFADGRALEKRITETDMGQTHDLDDSPLGVRPQATLDFSAIIDDLLGKRVIYVGESHTRYEDHKMQLRVIRELFNRDPNLAIGMEMFPRSSQAALDAYTNSEIDEQAFLLDSHYYKVWSYDYRLYREILQFARLNKIPVVGLNIEKDKVSKVFKDGGISALDLEEKASIPVDRDLDLPGYRQRLHNVFSMHQGHGNQAGFSGFLQAQAIWDETMAETTVNYLTANPEHRMVVLAGNGHMLKENAIPPRVFRRLGAEQAIVTSSDGGPLSPAQADYILFPFPDKLPPRALLGVVLKEADDQLLIREVSPKMGAEKAGLEAEDIILAIDGQPVTTVEELKVIMLPKKKGETIQLKIKRLHSFFPDEELDFEVLL